VAKPNSETSARARAEGADAPAAETPASAAERAEPPAPRRGGGKVERLRPAPSKPAALEGDDWLGAKLREVYDDVVEEPLPEEFEALLKKLDQTDPSS